MNYIEVEKCIKKLKDIKESYSRKAAYGRLKHRKKTETVGSDMKLEKKFEETTRGCGRFDLKDSFWTEVSELFGISRNACYNKWINTVDDLNNKLSKKDLSLVNRMVGEGKDWLRMSKEILCPPFVIFKEYMRSGVSPKPKMWSEEEDRLLEEGVIEYGASKWRFVSRLVGTKTGKECAMRFYFLNKNVKKGRWSEDEERKLVKAVEICGEGDWRGVSNHVMTRNPIQCRSKYVDEIKVQGKIRKLG